MCDKEKKRKEVHYSDYLQEEPTAVLSESLLTLYPVLKYMGCNVKCNIAACSYLSWDTNTASVAMEM
jgi:hypothetical protein